MKRHTVVAKKYEAVAVEVHVLACEDLMHVVGKGQGDVSLCQHLFVTLGGSLNGKSTSHARVEALKAWFMEMSGNQMTAEGESWKLKKGWDASKFRTPEEMEATPYWVLTAERPPVNLSFAAFMATLKGWIRKIETADEKGQFNGDPEKIKGLVAGVIDFAEERAKKLTAQELGTVSDQADKLLKENEAAKEAPQVETVTTTKISRGKAA